MDNRGKTDVEQLLREGHAVQLPPRGWSMYPLIVQGRDSVVIEPVEVRSLRRGDVILYRRDGGPLVLHRICRIVPEGYFTVGDNQRQIEGPLRPDQIRGRMSAVIRNGRTVPVESAVYRVLTGIWLLLRPLRPTISRCAHALKCFWGGLRRR